MLIFSLAAIGIFFFLLFYGPKLAETFFIKQLWGWPFDRRETLSLLALLLLLLIAIIFSYCRSYGACYFQVITGAIFGGIAYLLTYRELNHSSGERLHWDKVAWGSMALLILIVGFMVPYVEVWLNSLKKLETDWFEVNLTDSGGSSSLLISLREAELQIEDIAIKKEESSYAYADPIWIRDLVDKDKKYYRVLNAIEKTENPTSTKYATREQAIEDFSAFFDPSEKDEISLIKLLKTIKGRSSSYRNVNFVRTTMGPLAFSLRRFLGTFRSEKDVQEREQALADDLALSIVVSCCITDNFHGAWEKCRDDEEWRNEPSYERLKEKLSIVAKSLKRNEDRPPYLYLLLNALELRAGNKEGAYPAISELPCQEEQWDSYEGKCKNPSAWIEEDLNIHYWGGKSLQLSNPYWKPKDIYRKYNKMRAEAERVYALLENDERCKEVVGRNEICDAVKKRFRRARLLAWNGWAYYLAWTGETLRDALDTAKEALKEAKEIEPSQLHMYQDTLGFAILVDALKQPYYPKEKNEKLREAKGLFESAKRGIEEMERKDKRRYPLATEIYELHLGAVDKLLGTIDRDE
uniref:Uncharacterized protein n=1 Tax=Candidatus Kentrum sp. LPFa TaxID=2126335 RepID=A0A450WTV3_9GAMM|nr:MAG: hypothetical protein BECKLPF1236A_GA0070988_102622 [Candidatus Kentron sp. LPFa]VFK34192.1 MAG: hypothetical protein BECKLPF1236C_GA0070990_102512 [Candidatus Kentron sp. LPFa]